MSHSYDELLTAFAQHVGLDPAELALTQEIVVDDISIGLQCQDDAVTGDLVFFAVLGTPDAALFPRIARVLLEANSFWTGTGGATLGLQRETGAVTFCGKVAIADLSGPSLAALLDAFVDTAAYWRAFVQGTSDGGDNNPADFMIRA